MKHRKVLGLRTHLGGVLGRTSYSYGEKSTDQKDDMELWPVGVFIKSTKASGELVNLLVPFSNVVEAKLAPRSADDKETP